MRRVLALGLGALAGLVTLRLLRRRSRARDAGPGDTPECSDASNDAEDHASELRRKLDQARERGGDSIGSATVNEGADPSERAAAISADVPASDVAATDDTNGGSVASEPIDASELAERRARVHGRAREAAESMRDDGGSGAA